MTQPRRHFAAAPFLLGHSVEIFIKTQYNNQTDTGFHYSITNVNAGRRPLRRKGIQMQNRIKRAAGVLLASALVLVSASCGKTAQADPAEEQARFSEFTKAYFLDSVASDGISLHFFLKDPAALGITEQPNLGDFTYQSVLDYEKEVRATLKELEGFSYELLTDDQKLTYEVLKHTLELEVSSEGLGLFVSYATKYDGILTSYPQLMADYRFDSEQDVQNYLGLLADLPRALDESLDLERRRADAGLFMNEHLLDETLAASRAVLDNSEDSFMIESFEERLDGLNDLDSAARQRYLDENQRVWSAVVVPAGEAYLEKLEALRPSCTAISGLCGYENGKTYYEYLLRARTGLDEPIEELIQLLDSEMLSAVRSILLISVEDPEAVETMLNTDPQSVPDPEGIIEMLRDTVKEEFPPLDEISYQIKHVPECLQESSAPAYYLVPPFDAPTDNFIYINDLYDNQVEGESLVETLSHEGYPGHLYQGNYYRALSPDSIRLMMGFTGYTEGWANYVDAEVYRWLGYSPNQQEVLKASDRMNSILLARADLGVHYEGWDQQEILGLLERWGLIQDEELAEEVYWMVLEDPGNPLPYIFGELEFSRMRTEAEQRLGDSFDPIAFHKVILDCGPAPFSIVREKMAAYLDQATGSMQQRAA